MPLEQAQSLSEQIAKHISEQIIRGELVEGERIQELRIASETGCQWDEYAHCSSVVAGTHPTD